VDRDKFGIFRAFAGYEGGCAAEHLSSSSLKNWTVMMFHGSSMRKNILSLTFQHIPRFGICGVG
jgi:hypothetical protein